MEKNLRKTQNIIRVEEEHHHKERCVNVILPVLGGSNWGRRQEHTEKAIVNADELQLLPTILNSKKHRGHKLAQKEIIRCKL